MNPTAALGGLAAAGVCLNAVHELGLPDDAESIGNVHKGPDSPAAAGQL